ncbi:unnamed protein product [Rotaria socialis]|uniref:LIM zinc-binding domain-containing protein n=1 Tax=Rotaria socialis TaxID=392032 RepID=A0A818AJX4_9BILA|nr:unnamed protein product [Rotaria socialis]CAF3386470.1 unnamed protein product [Rotaria socialis]CAF3406675.1 unnamed protein product [Rotaria socialis]CAF3471801.1 unnamed protein product [Rotaria socialis]
MADSNEDSPIDTSGGGPDDTLVRLRNITKMFGSKKPEDDELQLQKVEKLAPGEKIKNRFEKFENKSSSNGAENDDDEDDTQSAESDGAIRTTRKKKPPREHVPYHEMAEVKDKFEKGLVDSEKPRVEKRLDVRVQSGLASSKKQAFEQGEFEQETESHVNKVQIDADLVAGLTSAKKQAFEQHKIDNDANLPKSTFIDAEAFSGATTDKKAKFEKGEFDQEYHEHGSNRVQADANLLVGAATERKAKFESGQVSERATTPARSDEIAAMVGAGNAQNKRSELLSKIEAEQQVQRSGDRHIDIDTEHGLAGARREQLATLANSEFKSTEKHIDVTTGLTSTIKEQYMADTSKPVKSTAAPVSVESGLAKSRATAFENPEDTSTIKRTVEIDNELLERGVAKERVAMFKNLQSGAQPTASGGGGDSKLRVDENGNVVRESDKREEIYFEKGQTKQLVEQWKTKQTSPERDTPDAQVVRDAEILQQGKAKNLVELWKTMDKENTPPPERRGQRAITPPSDNDRRLPASENDEVASQKPGYADDKANIESGHAKAVRESDEEHVGIESLISIVHDLWNQKTKQDELMQNVEQNNTTTTRKSLKQVTPPPDGVRRISTTQQDTEHNSSGIIEQYNDSEEFVPTKGQAQSLKNRFAEFEKDALKVETASAKIKYTPKRFVDTPAPKQVSVEPAVDPNKCSVCQKTVYAMEKIEADKKIYHKSCFKCMHCKSILKLGNFTANDGQIYCKPHFLQLFAIKGNYSTGFGLNDHKARWLSNSSSSPSSSPSSISNTHESAMSSES